MEHNRFPRCESGNDHLALGPGRCGPIKMRSRSSNSIWLGACSSTTVSEANTMRPALVVRSRTSEQVRSGSRRFARSTGRSFFRHIRSFLAWRRHGDCWKHSSRASVHAGSQERSLLLNPDGLEWRATHRLIGRLIQIALPKTAWVVRSRPRIRRQQHGQSSN